MKTCTKCGESKSLEAFSFKNQSKESRISVCKPCKVKATQTRQKTKEGLIKKIFHNQQMTTKKMGRLPPAYTEQELLEWAITQGYEQMWQTWTDSGHDKWLSPSVDRKDNNQSYNLKNIQLLTWRQNLDNQKRQNISGEYLHTNSKAVDQLSLEGEYIQTFKSMGIAMRHLTGARQSVSNITNVCEGKWSTAYGYKWRFALS